MTSKVDWALKCSYLFTTYCSLAVVANVVWQNWQQPQWGCIWTCDLFVGKQKASLSSTLRRLGEEIYRPRWLRVMEDGVGNGSLGPASGGADSVGDAPRDALFLRSHNQHVRLLSCIIILKTLSQGEWGCSCCLICVFKRGWWYWR